MNGRTLALIDAVPSPLVQAQIVFSPDGKLLAIPGRQGRTVLLWDVQARREIATLTGHRQAVFTVRFSPDSRLLASGSSDGTIKLWNVALRQEVATLKLNESGDEDLDNRVRNLVFSPDGNTLVAMSFNNEVRYLRAAGWAEIESAER